MQQHTQEFSKVKFVKEVGVFFNPITGRRMKNVFFAMNEDGKKGCLPGETTPYAPIGGINTLIEVVDILVWV